MSECPRCQCDTTESPDIYCSWQCEYRPGMIAKKIRSWFAIGLDGSQCFLALRDYGYDEQMSDSTVGRFRRVLMGGMK